MRSKYKPTVRKYIKLLDELPQLIKESGFKEVYIAEQLGISKKTFYNKKTLKNWSADELLKVLEIIGG